jgi:hypothetical protein
MIKVRVSATERDEIQARAGSHKLSDYIRIKALGGKLPDYSDRPVRKVIHTTVTYPEETLLFHQLVCIRQVLEALMSRVAMVTFGNPETEGLLKEIKAVHQTILRHLERSAER